MTDMDTDADEIKALMREAFEKAFQAQIEQLYKVYISNISVPDQHIYTKKGIENAVAAYRLAMAAVIGWEG